jgi:hypothetical protein
LRPEAPTTGYVDGAWWPRSRDLLAELPALLKELAVRLAGIHRVSYHLGEWDVAPSRVTLDGDRLRLSGFRSQPARTVDLIAADRSRITLLVIPPDADDAGADRTMALAAAPDNVDTVAELLAARIPNQRVETRSR